MMVALEIPVNPVPLGRPRVMNGRTFTPARSAEFADAFRWGLRAAGWRSKPITMPVSLTLRFHRRHQGNNRGDLDNLVKAVLDAGNGWLWADDRQIVELHASFAEAGSHVDGRIELTIDTDLEASR